MTQRRLKTVVNQNLIFLKQNTPRLIALSFVAATLVSVSLPLASTFAQNRKPQPTNHNNIVSSSETNYALSTTGILTDSDQVATKSDTDSVAVTNINGTTVDIPKDAEQGVTFGAEGQTLDIQLPNADTAALAKQAAPGVTTYDSGNGSASAVQPTEDGGLRMLTIIDNPNAPTSYDYKVSVPNGGKIQLTQDRGAIILNRRNKPVSTVATPWAKDAHGKTVQTHFTTDGQTLTQHVQHNVPGVVYPVTADPWWKPWTWTWPRRVATISRTAWNNPKMRRSILITAGCTLATTSASVATGGWGFMIYASAYGGCYLVAMS